jgi:predicted Zn-dependent protease
MTKQLTKKAPEMLILLLTLSLCLALVACSIQLKIPDVVDDRVIELVRTEAAQVVTVSDDRENFSKYQFFLSDFPRQDLWGMSVGNRRIYISYKLAARALNSTGARWLLRQTIAHEIAHETAGHAKQKGLDWFTGGYFSFGSSGEEVGLPWYVRLYNYPTEKELEADRIGLDLWNRLGWDCQIWVRILENFQAHDYRGDSFHPTDRRLQQAQNACEVQGEGREVGSTKLEIRNNRK